MLPRLQIRVPGLAWAGVGLLLAGACAKDNPVRPQVIASVTARVEPSSD